MIEKLHELNKSINASKKTKRLTLIVALFILAILPSIFLVSYSYYVNEDSNLVLEGTATIGDGDVILKIYLQNRDASGNPSFGYSRVYFIPHSEYTYVSEKTKCTNGVSIDGFDDYKFSISSTKKGVCEVYFDALDSSTIKSSPNGSFRIMAEQTPGKGDYVEVGKVPNGSYVINEGKTAETCSNVTLDGTTISITASSDIACVVYLDIVSNLATYLVNNVYKTKQGNTDPNGTAGLYYHDGKGTYTNANLEIGDNSYRYSGANPNNYICFSEDVDEETGKCADDNLYRIIGVIDNKVKLIKYTDINTNETLAWNSRNVNTWEGSTLETYLNGTYLNSLTFKDKIAETSWYVDGMPESSIFSPNTVKDTYEAERSGEAINKKIGLMYVSDYGYAALPTYWNINLYDYEPSYGNDWLLDANKEQWTISRYSDGSYDAFYVNSTGFVYRANVSGALPGARPSFSLPSSATITNLNAEEVGSKSTPMIIGSSATETTFPMYWNADFGGNWYKHPNTPSTTYGSVAELQAGYSNFASRPYYIKTTEKEHQACLYYNNKEFCLSKDYWEGEIDVDDAAAGNATKEKLQTEMAAAFGIEESSLSCRSDAYGARCYVGSFGCIVASDVYCFGSDSCAVSSDGSARCS